MVVFSVDECVRFSRIRLNNLAATPLFASLILTNLSWWNRLIEIEQLELWTVVGGRLHIEGPEAVKLHQLVPLDVFGRVKFRYFSPFEVHHNKLVQ